MASHSFCPKAVISLFFRRGQWCPLWWVLGLGLPAGAPKGHLPHRGSDGIHVCHPCGFILCNATGTHHNYSQFNCSFQSQGFWGCIEGSHQWWVSSLAGHCLLETWGGTTSCTISRGLVVDGDSCSVSSTCWCSSTLQHQAFLPPELWLWGLHLDSWGMGVTCPAAITSLEGCNTSLHPGNWVGDPTPWFVPHLGSGKYWCPLEVS